METQTDKTTLGAVRIIHKPLPTDPEKFFAAVGKAPDEYFQLTPLLSPSEAAEIFAYRRWYIDKGGGLPGFLMLLGERHGARFRVGFEYSPVIFAYLPAACNAEAEADLLAAFSLVHPDEVEEYTGRLLNTGFHDREGRFKCLTADLPDYRVWRFWWD